MLSNYILLFWDLGFGEKFRAKRHNCSCKEGKQGCGRIPTAAALPCPHSRNKLTFLQHRLSWRILELNLQHWPAWTANRCPDFEPRRRCVICARHHFYWLQLFSRWQCSPLFPAALVFPSFQKNMVPSLFSSPPKVQTSRYLPLNFKNHLKTLTCTL